MYQNLSHWLIYQVADSAEGCWSATCEEQSPHKELKLEPEMEPEKGQKALKV